MSKRQKRFRRRSARAAGLPAVREVVARAVAVPAVQEVAARAVALPAVQEVAAGAARLGITIERVIEGLRAIAFSDITRIVSWDTEKLTMTASSELPKTDAAAIAEIIASAKDQKIYRVKVHDKTPALALLTRILEKIANQDEHADDDGEEAREFLLQELDRLAAEVAAEEDDPGTAGGDPEAAR
jgi:hypothetical protein